MADPSPIDRLEGRRQGEDEVAGVGAAECGPDPRKRVRKGLAAQLVPFDLSLQRLEVALDFPAAPAQVPHDRNVLCSPWSDNALRPGGGLDGGAETEPALAMLDNGHGSLARRARIPTGQRRAVGKAEVTDELDPFDPNERLAHGLRIGALALARQ